jgi:predicted lipase
MIDWRQALKYGRLVHAAEQIRPGAPTDIGVEALIKREGYDLLETVYGDDLATDLDPRLGLEVTFGFVARSADGEAVVALRGTDNIWEWLQDGKFLMVPWGPGFTEDGFTAVYKSLRLRQAQAGAPTVKVKDYVASLYESKQVTRLTTCGHSLGGALATLLTSALPRYYPVTSYTFASPRVGDHDFAETYNSYPRWMTYRVENRFDLVPKLPPVLPLPYEHVADKYELKGKFSFNSAQEHHLTTYLSLMEGLS